MTLRRKTFFGLKGVHGMGKEGRHVPQAVDSIETQTGSDPHMPLEAGMSIGEFLLSLALT